MAQTRNTASRTRRKVVNKARKGFSASEMLKDAQTPLLFGLGMFAGKVVNDLLHKGSEMAGLGNTPDGQKATNLIKPAILIVGGLAIPQLVNNKYAKPLGAGIALFGGFQAIKSYLGKDVLSGLGLDKRIVLPSLIRGFGLENTASNRIERVIAHPPVTEMPATATATIR